MTETNEQYDAPRADTTTPSYPEAPTTTSALAATSAKPSPAATGRSLAGPRKSPVLACVLSLLPGVGQVYVGYYKLGFIHNLVFATTVFLLVSFGNEAVGPLFGIFIAFFFVYNVVDAGRRATLYNLALDGIADIELPQEMDSPLPNMGGSIVAGVVLMVLGVVLLLNTAFGVSLAWVEQWWPLAPILMGGYLFRTAWRERHQTAAESESDASPAV